MWALGSLTWQEVEALCTLSSVAWRYLLCQKYAGARHCMVLLAVGVDWSRRYGQVPARAGSVEGVGVCSFGLGSLCAKVPNVCGCHIWLE
jgi:hypothetical protein